MRARTSPSPLHLSMLFAVALVATVAAAPQQLGTIDFSTTGSTEAQPHFVRGVLLMHSFEYEDAAAAFREAQRLDPDFAMAYWGEAMTHNHPIWMQQDREAAIEALQRLAPTPAERLTKAGTEKERAWLEAAHVLFGASGEAAVDEADKQERDFLYRDALRRMHDRFPDDHEVTAFYALSILGTAHEGRDFRTYMRAAAIAGPVFAANPDHPGAAHYLIHSYDDPIHAPLGLPAARAYSKIAPAAAHAQHMTSHIFVAMGMWDDVAAANEAARDVQDAREVELGRAPVRCGHYSSWLQYGYLQQGRVDDAAELMDHCHQRAIEAPARSSISYFAGMRARYVLDTEDWAAAERWRLELSEEGGASREYAFIDAYSAAKRGDRAAAERILAKMKAAPGADEPRARILTLELEALLAHQAGRHDEAVQMLEEATALEEGLPYEFGPPAIVKPSHELLAEVLLDLERYDEADEAFEAALARTPRRTASLVGRLRCAEASGDARLAAELRAELRDIWRHADPDYTALAALDANR